ncbi:MAG: trypsin-like serine protease [Elusimicrobiota bacterium]|jgi:hypothetical protein|nr:trypsin-like serine protease [Elusimicrobiota bacterium]
MKRALLIIPLITLCAAAQAQSYLDVRNFDNTYEINIITGKKGETSREMAKCQAVRLKKDWYITAAHCLKPACDRGCDIVVRLHVGERYEMAQEINSAAASPVFKLHEAQNVDKASIAYDIALIHMDPDKAQYVYKDNKLLYIINKEDFLKALAPDTRPYDKALKGDNFPTLLSLSAQTPKILNRFLAVASIWDGKREVLQSNDFVFYSPKNHYLYTNNFGIRPGISGSGVVTSTRELVGIVSATSNLRRHESDAWGPKIVPMSYTFLSVFDDNAITFINRNISGGVKHSKSDTSYLKVVPEEYRPMTLAVDKNIT